MPEQLKKIAKQLREKAASLKSGRVVKTAQIVQAAVGLEYLRAKVGKKS